MPVGYARVKGIMKRIKGAHMDRRGQLRTNEGILDRVITEAMEGESRRWWGWEQ